MEIPKTIKTAIAVILRRCKPYLVLLAGMGLALVCWLELVYRLSLSQQYGAEPYFSQVAEGFVLLMYAVAAVTVLCFLAGAIQAFMRGLQARGLIYSFAALITLCYAVVLYVMHERKMLVTYGEYVTHMSP